MVEIHPVAIPAQTQEMAGPGLQGLGISRHLTPAPVFLTFLRITNSFVSHSCLLSSFGLRHYGSPSLPSIYTVQKRANLIWENDIYLQIVITSLNIRCYIA